MFKPFYKLIQGTPDEVEKELNKLSDKYYLMVFNPVMQKDEMIVLVQATSVKE